MLRWSQVNHNQLCAWSSFSICSETVHPETKLFMSCLTTSQQIFLVCSLCLVPCTALHLHHHTTLDNPYRPISTLVSADCRFCIVCTTCHWNRVYVCICVCHLLKQDSGFPCKSGCVFVTFARQCFSMVHIHVDHMQYGLYAPYAIWRHHPANLCKNKWHAIYYNGTINPKI